MSANGNTSGEGREQRVMLQQIAKQQSGSFGSLQDFIIVTEFWKLEFKYFTIARLFFTLWMYIFTSTSCFGQSINPKYCFTVCLLSGNAMKRILVSFLSYIMRMSIWENHEEYKKKQLLLKFLKLFLLLQILAI